jgi:hypothetical protein
MYILSRHFENPEQEIVCPLTGEAYVYLEGNDLTLIDPKYHDGAIEVLPRRFSQGAILMPDRSGQGKVIIRKPYDY